VNNDIFTFQMGTAVLFGNDVVQRLASKVKEFNASRVLIVTDKGVKNAGLLEKVKEPQKKGGVEVSVFDQVEPDPCLDTIHRGAEYFKQEKCDLIIALGGGSPIDTAKGIRVIADNGGHIRDYAGVNKVPKKASVPLIAIPTTSGTGSEVTNFAVLTDREYNMKITVTSPYLAPDQALVDPLLTLSAPPRITAASGIDALAHSIETYVSNISQPPADALALKAIQIIGSNIRSAVANGGNVDARKQMALASLISGMAFNNAFLGLTHSIGAALSGYVHVSHGIAISLLLPYVMEYNAIACLEKYCNIAVALGEKVGNKTLRESALAAAQSVFELVGDVNLPQHLSELGVKEDNLPDIARNALGHGMVKMNPRKPNEAEILSILHKAF
jgi:alcohol dehydrogenase